MFQSLFNLYQVAASVFVVKREPNFNSLLLSSPTCTLFIHVHKTLEANPYFPAGP